MPRRPKGVCVFCDSPGPLTNEHALQQWAREVLGIKGRVTIKRGGRVIAERRRLNVIAPQALCADCNGVWLGPIEDRFKDLMGPALKGLGPIYLDATEQEFVGLWVVNTCHNDLVPDVIEAALSFGFAQRYGLDPASLDAARAEFRNRIADVLRSDRIGWRIVEDRMVPFKSFELHMAVVEPTLLLLGGLSKFAAAEKSYQDALHEIARGNAADAITDASRALEETFEALGCDGNTLGDRIKDARTKGLIAAHDDSLLSPLEKFFHWASADRSEKGDAHTSPTTDIEDAWLTVHIVGALVMRLTQGTRRAT
jgi:hypothetical protein